MLGTGPNWSTTGLQVVVSTENSQSIELTRRLGAGGQGEVWEASGGRVAVKILRSRDAVAAQRLAERLRTVRLLDLDEMPLARPLSLLAPPYLGYTMLMLADMAALQHLVKQPSGAGDLAEWYATTGGLRRRLRLLGRLAGALAELHARGFCYGDPSLVNVMVSDSLEHEQVFLIDVDNIAVVSEVRDGAYVTPGYAAPEVVTGRRGVSSLSDAFAFAVMAFETLSIQHPFIGDLVHDGEPELEERAFVGGIPWVDHGSDQANRSSFGLPRRHTLTPGLRALAARTFEGGLADPIGRPTVGEWRTKLFEAADLTLTCEGCRGSFYGSEPACPWCRNPPPPALVARVLTQVPPNKSGEQLIARTRQAVLLQREMAASISKRTATGSVIGGELSVVTLLFDRTGQLTVRNRWDRPTWVVGPGGGPWLPVEPGQESAIPGLAKGAIWELHFDAQHTPHRLLRFSRLTQGGGR
ncbi:protein kinase domain-containing protein [Streptomyces californicus]|uniref:protein kinase domain-containing protein n=1 Tax=Streptomyces californicus TaxID=67351 RepID=UPI00067C0ABE|nr:protein kinase [Streptomyces californicus]